MKNNTVIANEVLHLIDNELEFIEYKRAAKQFFNEIGEWSYDEWRSHNAIYFDNALKVGAILWGLTPFGGSLGYFEEWDNRITLHTSLVRPSTLAPWTITYLKLGKQYASDVLLHEMMHQKILQIDGGWKGKSCHNCRAWANEIMRVGKLLGMDIKANEVKQRRINGQVKWKERDGYLTLNQMSTFPHCLRPSGFYENSNNIISHEVLQAA